jgi:hypothetical protein
MEIPTTDNNTLNTKLKIEQQKLHTLPEHLSSPSFFSGVRVTRSLVLCVCFVDRCLSFCTFSFGNCVVCSSSIYGCNYPFDIFKLSTKPLRFTYVN